MSSYMSNLLTKTTSKYTSLRRQLLSDEADGDTEDDSHISRVLRAYYSEKGRPFPPWLPPDPKALQSAPTQFVSSAGRPPGGPPQSGRGGGLSDLWDAPQQPSSQEPQSLRRAPGRGGVARTFQGRPGNTNLSSEPQAQGRPLPSQREGSYQSSTGGYQTQSPAPSTGSGPTAQERLKARLWGSGRSSPAQGASSANTSTAGTPVRSPFDRQGAQGGGRPPYPEERSSGYPQPGARQHSDYGASTNSPWSGNDDSYAPGGGNGGAPQRAPPGGGGGRMGLPSGPRIMRS